ncbi:MAG: LTA synthase family protein [Alistipes sp.]
MKRRITFLLATFCTTLVLLVLQKPVFLLFYASQAAAASPHEWLQVVLHGLTLDLTVAGYVTALPLLLTILSLWLRLSDRMWRAIFATYFVLISLFVAAVCAVDLGLYGYWGFRIDGSILIYLSDPKSAMASVGVWEAIRQVIVFVAVAVVMCWAYLRVVPLFSRERVRRQLFALGVLLLLGGLLFIAIRGGLSVATANISKVYFSSNMFLNHAATNPVFSLLSTVGEREDYAAQYPFFDEQVRAQRFESLRGDRAKVGGDTVRLLRTSRPNVVLVILESVGRTVMDAEVNGEAVMPNMQRFKREGVWFENFFANSFRTDRGEVAIMNGFPAQTRMSIMKLPAKSRTLPSIARSLAEQGYATSFTYGGDLNFTNQASYMYSTGWQTLVWQRDMHFNAPTSKWGYADDVVTDYFADQVLSLSALEKPFLAGLLTLSSHEPFDVPLARFDDKLLNAMAFTDDCVGQMIERWRKSPMWDNLLVVLIADHSYAYPEGVEYNAVLRHRIPMIWLGGALKSPHVVEAYGSQMDFAATLLGQMAISHTDFAYSKDIFDTRLPKFGYYTFVDGFGVADSVGAAIFDCTSSTALEQSNPALLDVGRTLLQTTYVDVGKR